MLNAMGKGPKKNQQDRTTEAIQAALTQGGVADKQFSKVEKKIWLNLEGAAKTSTEEGKTWMEIIEKFCESFCSHTIGAYSKEPWFPSLDLSPVVQEAVYDLLPAAKFRAVHQQHLHQYLLDRFNESYGRIEQEVHVDNLTWDVSEQICPDDKALFKKLHAFLLKSWTATRETILGEMVKDRRKDPADLADDFARRWINDCCGRISASTGDLQNALPEDVGKTLFQDMFQRGALPSPITNIIGAPPRGWRVVNVAVQDAYFENDPANEGKWQASQRGGKRKAPAWEPVTRDSPWAPKRFKGGGGAAKAKPKAAPAVKNKESNPEEEPKMGCLECTSAEECVGSPDDDLYKHIDRSDSEDKGDIYCAACWASFCEDNPDLEGELIPRSSL